MKDEVLNLIESESNDNWLAANRLLEDGSKESLKKFAEMDAAEMVPLSEQMLDYQIYDVNGFVGVLAITSDLKQFREFVFKLDGSIALKELLETGASLITQELVDDISIIKSDNRAIQKIIIILQKAIDKADTMVIISDGE